MRTTLVLILVVGLFAIALAFIASSSSDVAPARSASDPEGSDPPAPARSGEESEAPGTNDTQQPREPSGLQILARVVDEADGAVAGARVELYGLRPDGTRRRTLAVAETSADGTVVFPLAAPGAFQLLVVAETLFSEQADVEVTACGTTVSRCRIDRSSTGLDAVSS